MDLKPCPFCGGEAIILVPHWVRCQVCGCGTTVFGNDEEAVEMWNTRMEE